METQLTNKQRSIIFWASFLALMACGIGFGIRVMSIGIWQTEFSITGEEAGGLFGASLWPIAVGMILFSLIVDKIGYKISMVLAFASLAGSSIWSIYTTELGSLTNAFLLFGFGHGIVEAVINPLCATMYKKEKSKMLNILHASWPAGVAAGAIIFLVLGTGDDPTLAWREMFWFVLIPVIAFGAMFLLSHQYPEDERVENNVSYTDMLREFGGLGIFLATTFLFFEIAPKVGVPLTDDNKLPISLAVGVAVGLASGFALKSAGKILFFILCLIMIPLATAEIATDGWIRELMKPVLASEYKLDSGWAIVMSSFIMMVLRFFAGVPLRYMSPPTLLLVSALFSIAGLFLLSTAAGITIFIAFVFYGIGQTFYWPTVLGFTSEQFPKGGAMTLNTVSAMGLLTVGIFGVPFLGAVGDNYNAEILKAQQTELYEAKEYKYDEKTQKAKEVGTYTTPKNFFGVKYDSVNTTELLADKTMLTPKAFELTEIVNKGKTPATKRIEAAQKAKEQLAKLDTNDTSKDNLNLISALNKVVQAGTEPTDKAIAAGKDAAKELKGLSPEETYTGAALKTKEDLAINQRKVLKVAAILPAIMGVAFLLIALWYKSRGGYKAIHLDEKDYI